MIICILLWQLYPVKPGKHLQVPVKVSHNPAPEQIVEACAWSTEYALSNHAIPEGQVPFK